LQLLLQLLVALVRAFFYSEDVLVWTNTYTILLALKMTTITNAYGLTLRAKGKKILALPH